MPNELAITASLVVSTPSVAIISTDEKSSKHLVLSQKIFLLHFISAAVLVAALILVQVSVSNTGISTDSSISNDTYYLYLY